MPRLVIIKLLKQMDMTWRILSAYKRLYLGEQVVSRTKNLDFGQKEYQEKAISSQMC
jgi:hypothetical protein